MPKKDYLCAVKALKKEKHHSFKLSDHQPPHFHVVYNEYECWITIKDGIITGSLPRRAAKLVFEWLDLHEKELIENWERLQNSQQPQKIEPLK